MPNGKLVYERFLPGAFESSVSQINSGLYQIKSNIEHESDAMQVLGSTASNIKIEHRADGVYMSMDLLGDTISDDLYQRIHAKVVSGLSIEFQQIDGVEPSYSVDSSGNYVRSFTQARLTGFAVTSKPMYQDSTVEAGGSTFTRSVDAVEVANIEKELRGVVPLELIEMEAELLGVSLPWAR